jgi:hypothetical protein
MEPTTRVHNITAEGMEFTITEVHQWWRCGSMLSSSGSSTPH